MRLIDADNMRFSQGLNENGIVYVPLGEIKSQPTVEVVPVVHGEWIGFEYDGYADGCPVFVSWVCSECRNEQAGEDIPTIMHYCPNCGARMDGAE